MSGGSRHDWRLKIGIFGGYFVLNCCVTIGCDIILAIVSHQSFADTSLDWLQDPKSKNLEPFKNPILSIWHKY